MLYLGERQDLVKIDLLMRLLEKGNRSRLFPHVTACSTGPAIEEVQDERNGLIR